MTSKHLILILSFFMLSGSIHAQDALQHRNASKLTKWQFYKGDYHSAYKGDFDDSNWDSVEVPHSWNSQDILTKGPDSYKGPAWYRTSFEGNKQKDNRYFLRFNGASIVAEVFVNSHYVGKHEGAYSAFCFEITPYIYPDSTNTIAVKINNTFRFDIAPAQPILFPLFGGLYRPVMLFTTKAACISPLDYASSGVYITQDQVNEQTAKISVKTLLSQQDILYASDKQVDNETEKRKLKLHTSILNADNKAVAEQTSSITLKESEKHVSQNFSINKPHLWDAKRDPYLYTVRVELQDAEGHTFDKVSQLLGLRYFHVDKHKGLILNGETYDLYGVTRHQEWEGYGPALSEEQHRTDMAFIQEIGAHALRLAHYQQADLMYSLCDQYGIVVWAEIPVVPHYQYNKPAYLNNAKQQLIELIKQNYNHPAILFWGLYNEVKIPVEDITVLNNTAKSLDKQRLTTQADCFELTDRHYVTDLVAWNKYYGWYSGSFDEYTNWADEMLKDDKIKVGISEFGAGGAISQQQENPENPDPFAGKFYPEQYQRLYHEQVWQRIKDRDDLWCKFVWNTFDFSWEIVHRGDRPYINHKGLVTHDRQVKKDAFYFYKANWSQEPVLYIASRRHTERTEAQTSITVYTNLPKVSLYINGEKISSQNMNSDIHKIEWPDIKLSEGRNYINVVGQKDGKSYTDACEWLLK